VNKESPDNPASDRGILCDRLDAQPNKATDSGIGYIMLAATEQNSLIHSKPTARFSSILWAPLGGL
jgi:hypothetical protein